MRRFILLDSFAGSAVIWAITSYFNPLGYRRRLANYRLFRERLGLPLLTVELRGRDGFDLAPGDADIHIRIEKGDILWQKERLLNVALQSLPADCEAVVWTDCDVIFDRSDWPAVGRSLLDRCLVVQPFQGTVYLPPEWRPGDEVPAAAGRSSVAFIEVDGMAPVDCIAQREPATNSRAGIAWMARREVLERHGLYDACIIGGGDTAFLAATYGCYEVMMNFGRMNAAQQRHYLSWAEPFNEAVAGRAAAAAGNVFQLWHGDLRNRRYRERHTGVALHFDPYSDVTAQAGEAWRWSSNKPELHAWLRDYFASRCEDGEEPGTIAQAVAKPS
jgi:hypothetical protein